eukprot:7995736-Pyramimonas_sp.AAC.1
MDEDPFLLMFDLVAHHPPAGQEAVHLWVPPWSRHTQTLPLMCALGAGGGQSLQCTSHDHR